MVDPVALRQWLDSLVADDAIRVAFEAGNSVLAAELARAETVAETVPVPMLNTGQIMALLSPQSFAACFDSQRYSNFEASYNAGLRDGVKLWAVAFASRGLITTAERDAIHAWLDSTVEVQVPRWPGITADSVELARKVGGQ